MNLNPCRWLFIAMVFALDSSGQQKSQADLVELNQALSNGKRAVTIVCFGDSVTGVYYHTGGQRAYADMLGIALKQIYPTANVSMINAGISGNTTANALDRIDSDVLAHHPDLVTVMFGLNDTRKIPLENYRENLIEITKRCRAAGAKVILCTPNAVIDSEAWPVGTLIKYCDAVRAVAREEKVLLCDSYSEFESMAKLDEESWRFTLSGEIHPNMAGHKAIAEQLARTISGQFTSLADVAPPEMSIGKTLALLAEHKPVRILAMPPFDEFIGPALRAIAPDAKLEITPWSTEGMSVFLLRKDASHRVRKMKPDLVLVAVPRFAETGSRKEFIDNQAWLVNYAQSFGKKEWDVVVIHPTVTSDQVVPESDTLIRKITAAQDLSLIDRPEKNSDSAQNILTAWVKSQFTGSIKVSPSKP